MAYVDIYVTKRVDIRPFDFDSGKRLAIPADQQETCQCCGKKIVKVNHLNIGGIVGDECAEAITRHTNLWAYSARTQTVVGAFLAKMVAA
jgi:hypothetical protein